MEIAHSDPVLQKSQFPNLFTTQIHTNPKLSQRSMVKHVLM